MPSLEISLRSITFLIVINKILLEILNVNHRNIHLDFSFIGTGVAKITKLNNIEYPILFVINNPLISIKFAKKETTTAEYTAMVGNTLKSFFLFIIFLFLEGF